MATEVTALMCNLCGSESTVDYLKCSDQKTGDPTHRLHLVKCRHCGLVYLSPKPDPEVAEQYFREVYTEIRSGGRYDAYYHDNVKLERKAERRLNWIKGRGPCDGELLDIGAGRGYFVQAAQRGGRSACGVELDRAACEFAKEKLNVEIKCGVLECGTYPPSTFQVITLWDLIEHVDNPLDLLRTVFDITIDGGRVYIRTANIDSWAFAKSPQTWDMLFSGHLFYFSPETITRLLMYVGFRLVKCHDAKKVDGTLKNKRARGLESTGLLSGITKVFSSPRKITKIPIGLRQKWRRARIRRRYPETYYISIMLVEAVK